MLWVTLWSFLIISLHRNLSQNGQQLKGALNGHCGSAPPYATPPLDVMHEVSVGCSDLAGAGSGTKEIRRTISLPEECSKSHHVPKHASFPSVSLLFRIMTDGFFVFCFSPPSLTGRVFITYSVDIAKEMFMFVKFLVDQGFRPSVSPSAFDFPQMLTPLQMFSLALPFLSSTCLTVQSEAWVSTNGWTVFWMM